MSDTYDDNPIHTHDTPPCWVEGDYLISIEPLTRSYSICAVHASRTCKSATSILAPESGDRRYSVGPVATVIMQAPPALDLGTTQCWVADAAALDRAVRMAIRECEKGGTNENKIG